jgi:hypothetical protein
MSRSSHVVQSEVENLVDGGCLWTHVTFSSRKEVQSLIDALIKLRDAKTDLDAHLHLQAYGLSPGSPSSSSEIIFVLGSLRNLWTSDDRELWKQNARALVDTLRQ